MSKKVGAQWCLLLCGSLFLTGCPSSAPQTTYNPSSSGTTQNPASAGWNTTRPANPAPIANPGPTAGQVGQPNPSATTSNLGTSQNVANPGAFNGPFQQNTTQQGQQPIWPASTNTPGFGAQPAAFPNNGQFGAPPQTYAPAPQAYPPAQPATQFGSQPNPGVPGNGSQSYGTEYYPPR